MVGPGGGGGDEGGGAGCGCGGKDGGGEGKGGEGGGSQGAGHGSGGAYTKGSLVPLVWSRSQIWSPTLILDVIGMSHHLPERDRTLSAQVCLRCTPSASAGCAGVVHPTPQRGYDWPAGGAGELYPKETGAGAAF